MSHQYALREEHGGVAIPWGVIFVLVGIVLLFLAGVYSAFALAAPVQAETEREACDRLAPKYGAETEVVLWDRTRCDLVTDTEAIEVDWAANGKWAEAIGQSLYYAAVLDKRPAIILLVRDRDDYRYVYRCFVVCQRVQIRLYVERSP